MNRCPLPGADKLHVKIKQILEDEHFILDFLRQIGIVFTDVIHNGGFNGLPHKVENFGRVTHAAHGGLFGIG